MVLESARYSAGLAKGESTDLTVSFKPDAVGALTLVARADVLDDVPESDESDNEWVLEITVKSLGNLTFPANGFTVTPDPNAPASGLHFFQFTLANTGSSAVVETVSVKFFAYTSAGQYVEWGTHDLDVSLAPGGSSTLLVAFRVDPGTYRAYALADTGETVEETDEGDNEAYFDFTAL